MKYAIQPGLPLSDLFVIPGWTEGNLFVIPGWSEANLLVIPGLTGNPIVARMPELVGHDGSERVGRVGQDGNGRAGMRDARAGRG